MTKIRTSIISCMDYAIKVSCTYTYLLFSKILVVKGRIRVARINLKLFFQMVSESSAPVVNIFSYWLMYYRRLWLGQITLLSLICIPAYWPCASLALLYSGIDWLYLQWFSYIWERGPSGRAFGPIVLRRWIGALEKVARKYWHQYLHPKLLCVRHGFISTMPVSPFSATSGNIRRGCLG